MLSVVRQKWKTNKLTILKTTTRKKRLTQFETICETEILLKYNFFFVFGKIFCYFINRTERANNKIQTD